MKWQNKVYKLHVKTHPGACWRLDKEAIKYGQLQKTAALGTGTLLMYY